MFESSTSQVLIPILTFGLVLVFWLIGVLYLDGRRRRLMMERQKLSSEAGQAGGRSWLQEALDSDQGGPPIQISSPRGWNQSRMSRMSFVVALVIYTIVWIFAANALMAFSVSVLSLIVMRRYISLKKARQARKNRKDCMFAIRLASRALRGGTSLSGMLQVLGREVPGEIGQNFMEVVNRMEMGASVEEAISNVLMKSDVPELRAFSVSLLVQARVGGDLPRITDRLCLSMDDSERSLRRARAILSYGRGATMVLLITGLLLPFTLAYQDVEYRNFVLNDPLGHMILSCVIILFALGLALVQRYLRSDILQARETA